MCMEDVRLGRKTTSRVGSITLAAATPAAILPRNANRVAVIISVTTAGGIAFVGLGPEVLTNGGPAIIGSAGPLILNVQQHGSFVRSEIWGMSVAGATIGWMETVLEEQ